MQIDNLTIGEGKQLAALFSEQLKPTAATPSPCLNEGLCICVMDKGFVYVGELIIHDKTITIQNAQNIRRWGTTNGLGQLASEGIQPETKLDNVGIIRSLTTELKHWIPCKASAWTR